MKNIIIKNCIVLPVSDKYEQKYFKGYLAISGDKITAVKEGRNGLEELRTSFGENCHEIDGTGCLIMPGLINIHNHVSMSLMRGYADDIPLFRWLHEYIWPFEAKLTPQDIQIGARLGIAEMLLGGTTCFTDMYWSQEAVAKAVESTGIRAVLSPTFTDDRFDDFLKDFDIVAAKYGSGKNPLITLMIAPHSPYTCSVEHLEYARDLAEKHNIGLNIHVSETLDEQTTVLERYAKTPIAFLDSLGMLKRNTLTVHCVHVNTDDISIMSERGVSVAYNPQSNMKISSGAAPVAEMIAAGLNIGIGTDGPCSNNDLDMWDELRSASFLQKHSTGNPCVLPAYEVIKMATANGAAAVGLGDVTGRLEPGMKADIIMLDMQKPHLVPCYDAVANLVYAAKSTDVDTVIVDGKIVVQNGTLTGTDIQSLCMEAQETVNDIMKR